MDSALRGTACVGSSDSNNQRRRKGIEGVGWMSDNLCLAAVKQISGAGQWGEREGQELRVW